MSPPDRRGVSELPMRPCPKCARERHERARQLGRADPAMLASIRACSAGKLKTTPFGVPVVREVNKRSAGSSGSIARAIARGLLGRTLLRSTIGTGKFSSGARPSNSIKLGSEERGWAISDGPDLNSWTSGTSVAAANGRCVDRFLGAEEERSSSPIGNSSMNLATLRNYDGPC
jgi:hypothetical protein